MENKETFNYIVSEYERFRPAYPKEMFDDIADYSSLKQGQKILEIGCGTGQATGGFVDKGFTDITCVELGDQLAQFTAEKFKGYPSVKVLHTAFEDWNGEGSPFDLAISGTAFHFIEPDFGYRRVWELLKHNGSMAFFWTVHVPMYDDLHQEIRLHYRELAPHLDDAALPTPEEIIEDRRVITDKSGFFNNLRVKEYREIHTLTSSAYVSLLNTNSKHRQLPKSVKDELFHRIQESVDRAGGTIHKEHRVALYLAAKA
ncbi:class I SAM-dependent methyltransferase [Paenibacillus shunpengii]|uniref:Class I SAM-dependent methyltransferase n=1 Tax=Paenibacillus shunpengii TaxID=2054424 RepID=A0ABW5SJY6_9BACL|nr:class I SAM-dependent methyltransferase [Paenibacillus sp. FSL H7-0326]OMC71752.1 SAM-dependent methyltransferase [Paenibacillus sp. FSL H7-0326]